MRHRATGILIYDNKILLMFRRKSGREYWVFPGGGIEANEDPAEATIRELKEETTVLAEVEKQIYEITLDDGTINRFYLCHYLAGEPKLGLEANEGVNQSENNFYQPQWVDLNDLKDLILYPLEIRDWLINDLKQGFDNEIKKASFVLADMRKV